MSMNKWEGIGNLTREPETRTSESGLCICTFSVAVNRPKDRDGNSKADFIPVKALGKQGEACAKWLHKGSRVGVVGTLTTYTYENENGEKRFKMEVLLQDLTFLGESGGQRQQGAGDTGPTPPPEPSGNPGEFTEVDDDELPF